MKIPLARPYYSEEDVNDVKAVLDSRWVAQGSRVEEFEKKFANYIGAKHGIAVNSCTSGLHLSLLALGIEKGDEVIIPDFTFPATGNAVLFVGAKPIIADIDIETFNINTEQLKEWITKRTKAIIPVHAFGQPADMKSIIKSAANHNLYIVEDSAGAIGSELDGKKIGTFGDLACFSFHARKLLSTGEGGMITTDNDELAKNIRSLRSHGMSLSAWKREKSGFCLPSYDVLGYNFRMSDITAAIGISQLCMIEKFVERRRELANYYNDQIEDSGLDIVVPQEKANVKHSYQSYVIFLRKYGIRGNVIRELQKKGVGCTIGYYSLSNLPLFSGECPNGKKAFENTIALPMYYELTKDEIGYVVKTLGAILEGVK